MNKKVGFYTITTTYVGTMFGAGFVSGQELLQFFAAYPSRGIFGVIILALMVLTFAFIVMHSSYISQPKSFEQLIVGNNKTLKFIVNFLFLFFSAGVLVIMFAGAGALGNSLFNVPNLYGSIVMAFIVLIIGLSDTTGIMDTFKILTPIMFVIAVTTALLGFTIEPSAHVDVVTTTKYPWWFSAILYMTYNFSLAIALLSPLGKNAKSVKEILKGALCSSIILCIISMALVGTIIHNLPNIIEAEMPMLTIANNINPIMGNIYAFVLFGGLIAASIGMLFAILNYFESSKNKVINNRKITVPILCIIALSLSSVGFSNLISIVYPILGYFGIAAIIGVVINYIYHIKNIKKEKGYSKE